jgi:signal transduction histidine kinase
MAHDFNNYLGVIVSNLDRISDRPDIDPTVRKAIEAALDGALRSADLTRSLLAFSRRQPLNPATANVNRNLEVVATLLGRTLGPDIELITALAPNLHPVRIDAAQFDSCILNLATNARDAMPTGGSLVLSTRNIEIGAEAALWGSDLAPGPYIVVEVSDTGQGMSQQVASQAFEPFFTTKPSGHGTGLGLSMVYGFVKQSRGHIAIDSAEGRGTTIRIYLPADLSRPAAP